MRKIIFLELCFLFLATTFQSDNSPGWFQQTIPRPDLTVSDLQFLDSLTGFVIKYRINPDTAFIYKTTDGGNNWTSTQFNNVRLTSIDFVDSNTGYCAGGQDTTLTPGIVKKTTNRGETWFTVSYVSNYIYLQDICFVNRDTGWVSSTDIISGGLWRTVNGGYSWQMQMNENYDPSKIFFINSTTGWVLCTTSENLYKTTNCGVNWFAQTTFDGRPTDVFFASPDTGWVIKSIGNGQISLMRSTNGGNNWHAVNTPVAPSETRLFFINNKIGWGGSGFNKIFATKDGYNWGYQTSQIWGNYNISFIDSFKGWAGSSGLVHTTDGGGNIISGLFNNSETIPDKFSLVQNFPNPFNPNTVIGYLLSINGYVSLKVYDITGKAITSLYEGIRNSGDYEVNFNGSGLPSGTYFYTLTVSDPDKRSNQLFTTTKKMILVR